MDQGLAMSLLPGMVDEYPDEGKRIFTMLAADSTHRACAFL
jgi:hypothetical protein